MSGSDMVQRAMRKVPDWLLALRASNARERDRLRDELGKIKGVLPLLMKPRNGGRWSAHDKAELRRLLRLASSVSPYLVALALPGSVLMLPLLAWHLDVRRQNRRRREGDPPA